MRLQPSGQPASLRPTPEEQSILVAELATMALQRSLTINQSVVDVLHQLYTDAGPGSSRLRRKATHTDGLWADLARPRYPQDSQPASPSS